MKNKLKSLIKNKKGLNTIELVIIAFAVMICISGLLDLTNIMKKHNAVSTTINYVTRTVGKQGGLQTSKPAQFPDEYISNAKLYTDVKKNLENSGIESDKWHLYITVEGQPKREIKANTIVPTVTYGKKMQIELSFEYDWKVLSSVTPFRLKGNNTANRQTYSKFKIRNSSSIGNSIE